MIRYCIILIILLNSKLVIAQENNNIKPLCWIPNELLNGRFSPNRVKVKDINENSIIQYYLYKDARKYDLQKATCWLKLSAEHGFDDAQFELAELYEQGNGIDKNIVYANQWRKLALEQYETKAKKGNSDSSLKLAKWYSNYMLDDKTAFYWFNFAAQQNNQQAKIEVAQAYLYGKGTVKDIDKAKIELELLVEKDNSQDAAMALGNIYENGIDGKINPKKSIYYYFYAAVFGNKDALLKLSQMYRIGFGVEKDIDMANGWLKIYNNKMGMINE